MIDVFTDIKIIRVIKVSVDRVGDRTQSDRTLNFTLRFTRWKGPDRAGGHAFAGEDDRAIWRSRGLPGFLYISKQQGIICEREIFVS